MSLFKCFFMAGVVVTTATVLPSQSKASDWGCEILLCLSGDWKGTASCHPPVYRLIDKMKLPGFSWPTCPQANSSKAKYEPYKQCPEGFASTANFSDRDSERPMCKAVVRSGSGRGNSSNSSIYKEGPLKIDDETTVNVTRSIEMVTENRGNVVYSFPQPQRSKPYYIDYDDANKVRQRIWFRLNK